MTVANTFSCKKASSQWKLTIEGFETMSSARSDELRVISELAFESLDQSAATPEGREGQLDWLLESPLHVREVLAAMEWDEQFCGLLDPDHRIDADGLIAKALSSTVVSPACGRTTGAPASEHGMDSREDEIVDLGDAIENTGPLMAVRIGGVLPDRG